MQTSEPPPDPASADRPSTGRPSVDRPRLLLGVLEATDEAKIDDVVEQAHVAAPDPTMTEAERVQWLAEQEVRFGEAMENGSAA